MPGGRRGGGSGGGRGPQAREVLVSKKLSWLLRHGAEKEGLVLGKGGYVGLGDVVSFLVGFLLVFVFGCDVVLCVVVCSGRYVVVCYGRGEHMRMDLGLS